MRPTRRLLVGLGVLLGAAVASAGFPWLAGPAWAWLVVLGALALLDVSSMRSESAVEVRFEHPPTLRVREPFFVSYHLRNPVGRTLTVMLLDAREPALGGDQELGPLSLPTASSLAHRVQWVAMRRGVLQLGPLHARSSSPLGLFERRLVLRQPGVALRVLPNPGSAAQSVVGPHIELGQRARRTRGESLELDSLRPYTEGDDPRHVDWQATARAQQLIVRTFREERNQSVVVAVDAGRMMATRVAGLCKFDHALNTTAALAQAALVHGDRVALLAFDAEIRTWVPAQHARRGMAHLFDASLELQPRAVESSFRVLAEKLDKSQRKRALIIILTDFVESADALELEGHLARLARRHVVLLVALRDPILSELDEPRTDLDEAGIYRRLVLQDLSSERSLVLRRLTRLGVHALDLRPEQSRAPVLSRYLALRGAL